MSFMKTLIPPFHCMQANLWAYCPALLAVLVFQAGGSAADPELESLFANSVRPLLQEYCGACHAEDASGKVASSDDEHQFLHAKTVDDLQADRSLWASASAQLRNRTMPPVDERQPSEAERLQMADWIEKALRETACNGGEYAGWIPARRLNRVEYDNTVRDLLGVELGFSKTLPVDSGGGEGFDNNGETLFLPPLLLERYLESSQQIVDATIVTPDLNRVYSAAELLPPSTDTKENFREVPAGGKAFVLVPISLESDYRIIVGAYPDDRSMVLPIEVDGIEAAQLTFHAYGQEGDANQEETLIRLTRGLHTIALKAPADRAVRIVRVKVEQPSREPSPAQLAIHQRLLGMAPGTVPAEARSAAEQLLWGLLRVAFRRPPTSDEVQRFLTLYDRADQRGDAYEQRIKLMLKGVLVSPEFLFRIETPPTPGRLSLLTDHELATRLSYFLWSTMPDEELRRLADQGRLQDAEVLAGQVSRMLHDPKAGEFYASFIGQWLGTRDVGGSIAPTDNSIQHFYTPEVATDMRQEAVLLFQSIVQSNGSLLQLIDSDFQYMTGRLAKFYGVEGAERLIDDEFQRVDLPDPRRGGVLGLGAVLALTSHTSAKETSPVLRGAWVLDTLLGTPVPAPPPDVPALDAKAAKARQQTLREALEIHRQNPSCAACHDLIDPIGFGLENFDYLGRLREDNDGKKIDTLGSLPSGESFNGPQELKQILLTRKRDFLRQLSRKVLGYALGRSLTNEDQCAIEQLVIGLEESDCSAQKLIEDVVLSTPFRFKGAASNESAVRTRNEQP